jgi:Secretion system C-terminal sorting domain
LDAHGLLYLEELYCSLNQLTLLNVQGLPALKYLFCTNNQLTSLDAHGLSNLVSFDCSLNQLSSINLEGLIRLRGLFLTANLLTNIDIYDLIKLESFTCNYNKLTTLDLRNQNQLNQLRCNDNQLSSLFIKNGHTEISELLFNSNPLEYICCDDEDLFWVYLELTSNNIMGCNVNTYCSFSPGGVYYTVKGENRVDLNGNGCDANDSKYPNLKFSINDGINNGHIISNESGLYSIKLSEGLYTIKPEIDLPDYFIANPTSFQVNLPGNINPLMKNFCITKTGTHHDLEIDLIPLNVVLPGFDADYLLSIKNKGTEIEQGDFNLIFDSMKQDFISANPVPNIQISDTLKWAFTNLLPLESRVFKLKFSVNTPTETPPVNIGNILHLVALIDGVSIDEVPEDNIFNLSQTVVGAFDPNDKTCLEGDQISFTQIGNYLHYIIRFENTGTYAAKNIVVKDIIDTTKFDLSSLQLTQSSHSCFIRILRGNQVEFIFEDIDLPFIAPDKYGFVAFKIKTKTTLVLGDSVTNQADIFFDYNFPITTNQTSTTVVQNVGSVVLPYGNRIFFKIQPNPTSDILYLTCDQILKKIEIYDVFGRISLSQPVQNQQINITDLPNGTYFIKVSGNDGFGMEKVIKK